MDKTDIVIIGAGVVGLAIARELSGGKRDVVVVEKNKSFGRETSSRNSEVIHGGMYYPENTLKAQLCVTGRELLYEYCALKKIPHKKVGKLIVATCTDELASLRDIERQGSINGVKGLNMLTEAGIKKLEPNISGIAALYSGETGIIDSHSLMDRLAADAEGNGTSIVYDAEVTSISKDVEGYNVCVINAGEKTDIRAYCVINSAGLDSDSVAGMAGIDVVKEKYSIHFCKGQYFRVAPGKSRLVERPVYPVPRPSSGGLGIHVTPDMSGSLRLGPDDNYINGKVIDYSVDESKKRDFLASVVKFFPAIAETDLTPDTAGLRPKLQPKGGEFRDFVIREESDKGLPGFIDLIGIESPGLTASLAIAKKVSSLVNF